MLDWMHKEKDKDVEKRFLITKAWWQGFRLNWIETGAFEENHFKQGVLNTQFMQLEV